MFYIGLYSQCRENMKKSSCLKPQGIEPLYLNVASPSRPLLSSLQIMPRDQKCARPGGHMFCIDLYRIKMNKSSCLKPQGNIGLVFGM